MAVVKLTKENFAGTVEGDGIKIIDFWAAWCADIRSIPTLMVVRDGVTLYSRPGALPETALEDLIGRVRALDMDEVQRQVAANKVGA